MSDGGDLTARASFSPEPTAPSRARSFTRDALRSWGLPPGLIDDAVLLVSELVANGVQHAGTRLEVSCRLVGAVLEVRVADRHPARVLPDPGVRAGDTDSERGRGLLLPTAIASAWGVTYQSGDKTVWFLLPVPGRQPASVGVVGGAGNAAGWRPGTGRRNQTVLSPDW